MSERSISPYERYGKATPVEDAAFQIHVYTATDTLASLAEKYLGDWRLWRIIADKNKIIDPRQILLGTELIIPRKLNKKGGYETK